ncbi:hypothetical protein EJ08DRAFT_713502 [Tothia fuscella]|uniref:Uncharacterized protein n=1 Tax=Tothia fuscella TaxID=1048955 RepID=A0A9P4TZL6_9PEZI|nr:hypothetical protein EJ08DRAFT_713502 [Tothia fuscella]
MSKSGTSKWKPFSFSRSRKTPNLRTEYLLTPDINTKYQPNATLPPNSPIQFPDLPLKKPQAPPTEFHNFADLPRELRDLIYTFYTGPHPKIHIGPAYWKGAKHIFRIKPTNNNGKLYGIRTKHRHPLLFCNKQINEEYLETIVRNGHFYYILTSSNLPQILNGTFTESPFWRERLTECTLCINYNRAVHRDQGFNLFRRAQDFQSHGTVKGLFSQCPHLRVLKCKIVFEVDDRFSVTWMNIMCNNVEFLYLSIPSLRELRMVVLGGYAECIRGVGGDVDVVRKGGAIVKVGGDERGALLWGVWGDGCYWGERCKGYDWEVDFDVDEEIEVKPTDGSEKFMF